MSGRRLAASLNNAIAALDHYERVTEDPDEEPTYDELDELTHTLAHALNDLLQEM